MPHEEGSVLVADSLHRFLVILFLCCNGAEASIIICFVSGKMEAHGDHMAFPGLWFRNRDEIHQI